MRLQPAGLWAPNVNSAKAWRWNAGEARGRPRSRSQSAHLPCQQHLQALMLFLNNNSLILNNQSIANGLIKIEFSNQFYNRNQPANLKQNGQPANQEIRAVYRKSNQGLHRGCYHTTAPWTHQSIHWNNVYNVSGLVSPHIDYFTLDLSLIKKSRNWRRSATKDRAEPWEC
jgi:hypothetical protein